MSPSNAPNPERRSTNALLCFCIGIGLCVAAYVLGFGAAAAMLLSGGNPVVTIGSLAGVVALAFLGIAGFILILVGGIWMIIQVIADQRSEPSEKRYRDVER